MRKLFVFIALCYSVIVSAQSVSGSVKTQDTKAPVSYANVYLIRDGKVVTNTFSNADGSYQLNVSAGLYTLQVIHITHDSFEQTLMVNGKETVDVFLKPNTKKIDAVKVSVSGDSLRYGRKDYLYRKVDAVPMMEVAEYHFGDYVSEDAEGFIGIDENISAGSMTAGEVNDFSKWELWTDLREGEFEQYSTAWMFSPTQRFMVEVMDLSSLPLADALVKLIDEEGKLHYAARTDNTGKAELWSDLLPGEQQRISFRIEISYGSKTAVIRNAKPFGKGSNTKRLDADCDQSQIVDIAFVVDATGSMGDEIAYLKMELSDVIVRSKSISDKLQFRYANVFYRDLTDDYITKHHDFTDILSAATTFIEGQSAAGGGDGPEAVEIALDTAINHLSWSSKARARLLFLVLDAPPHNTPEIQEKMRILSAQAAEKGIRIIPVSASGIDKATEYLLRSVALATNGTYTFVTNHSGIGNPHIEPSTDEYEVELLNEMLIRLIKSFTYMPDCEQNIPDLELPYSDSTVTVKLPVDTTVSHQPVLPQWRHYPNPTQGPVNIEANQDIKILYVTDLGGKLLQTIEGLKAHEIHKIDLSNYASGVYLIRYPVDDRWVSGKILLQR